MMAFWNIHCLQKLSRIIVIPTTCVNVLWDAIVSLSSTPTSIDRPFAFSNDLSRTILYRNRTRFKIHRPSVENSLVLIVVSVKYNQGSEKNIENRFFHINLRPGAWTSCNKGVLQKLKRHGNGGSCLKNTKN